MKDLNIGERTSILKHLSDDHMIMKVMVTKRVAFVYSINMSLIQ